MLFTAATFAQQTETEIENETAQEQTNLGTKVGSITVGAYLPIAFGENFVNDGMDLKTGAQAQLKLNVLGDFWPFW